LQHPSRSPSSLYFVQLQNNDIITIGNIATNAPILTAPSLLTYDEAAIGARTNGLFVTVPVAVDYLLPQDWNDVHSFAGLVPGEHWACGVPYQQRLHAITNSSPVQAPVAYTVLVAYSPPEAQTLTAAPRLQLDDGSSLPLSSHPIRAWRGWPMPFNRMVLLDYAKLPPGRSLSEVAPSGTLVMALTAFNGSATEWQPYEQSFSNASAAFIEEEKQRELVVALQASFAQLPADKIALLPLSTGGAAANFASLTGLDAKWRTLTETQLVDSNFFTASHFPLAFYLGSENYLKTVTTSGDAKAAVTRYLSQGGTLVVLATGPFPFYYGYGPNDQPGSSDPLLPQLGLPIYNAFEQAPPNLSMAVTTNQSILHSVPSVFPFPPGDSRLRPVNRGQVLAAHRYIPWLSVTNFAGQGYGDAACFIEFGSGPAKGGKVLYIWSTLLSGPQGQAILANAVSWIIDGTLRPPAPRFDSINRQGVNTAVAMFNAVPNLDYTLQSRNDLGVGSWQFFQEFGSSPVDRLISAPISISLSSGTPRFFRIWVRP
jgi:hypothetical protein